LRGFIEIAGVLIRYKANNFCSLHIPPLDMSRPSWAEI
jgi:hypothetical protein